MTSPETKYTLYTYFRSSCSARLRIALNLKEIPYSSIPVNLLKGEQLTAEHRSINPSATVPALVIESETNNTQQKVTTIAQSLAALEYLEETHPTVSPLLPPPSKPEERATVRTLSNIIACDIQPVTNLRILKRVGKPGINIDREKWSRGLVEDGFRAYETIITSTAGKFSVGDSITMADVCLVPAVWAAERVGVDLAGFPTMKGVVERLEAEDAVRRAHWRGQEDTPEEFRWKDGE